MPTPPTREDVERRFLGLVEDAALPAPDEIEHWEGEVAFFWNEQKLVVIVELDGEDLTRDELLSLVPAEMA
jgi:hypothetical protein